jgi:hypothetical protein
MHSAEVPKMNGAAPKKEWVVASRELPEPCGDCYLTIPFKLLCRVLQRFLALAIVAAPLALDTLI